MARARAEWGKVLVLFCVDSQLEPVIQQQRLFVRPPLSAARLSFFSSLSARSVTNVGAKIRGGWATKTTTGRGDALGHPSTDFSRWGASQMLDCNL